jgi:tetratricopeptide (TPR) repeat protein
MRKFLLTTVLSFIVSEVIFSQNIAAMQGDSLRIDSLIKKIPPVKDTARINYLNNLSRTIIYSAYPQKAKVDWAYPYVEMAYNESKQSGFKTGTAKALMRFCQMSIYVFITNVRSKIDNGSTMNKFKLQVTELLDVAKEINDPEILGVAYDYESDYFGRSKRVDDQLNAQKNAVHWYKKAGNDSKECETNLNISYTYLELGEFENAFEYCNRSLELAKKLVKSRVNEDNDIWLQLSYINVSDLYKIAGDYETAMRLLRESRQFHLTEKSKSTWGMEAELAGLFLASGQYDSALHYLKPVMQSRKLSYQWPAVALAYLKSNNIDSALKYYNLAIDSMEKRGMVPAVVAGLRQCYFGRASIFYQQKKYNDALKFARKSLVMEQRRTSKLERADIYELMSDAFHKLGNNDSAYLYLVKHNELKNSLLTRQFLWRLNNYKQLVQDERKTSQFNLLNKDNQLKEQKLRQQVILKNGLIIGLLLVLLLGVFVFRSLILKRKNEKLRMQKDFELRQLENDKKQAELEMQALRAQMNPHFIFNCLSSINRFILKNESKVASNYLTRFSRLMRMVLMNSQKPLIALESELEMLGLYLEMERLRFKNSFDYGITFLNAVDPDNIFIPPLLLQPFCENAIWHGLMHKEGPGRLDIELRIEDNILNCVITDNGVGREKAEEMNSRTAEREKSMGLKITKERLALFNREKEMHTFYEIEDLKDENGNAAGTKVTLKICLKQPVEQLV